MPLAAGPLADADCRVVSLRKHSFLVCSSVRSRRAQAVPLGNASAMGEGDIESGGVSLATFWVPMI